MAKMAERVKAIMTDPEQIRNIAICAHIDHGKTTFSDNLLAGAGMMSEELAGKALQLDFHEDEQERGITIDSAAVSMIHKFDGKDYLINLIDTPGHVDFGGDVTRAMRAVDGSIVLVCAVEGVMPQTETVLRQALKERVKPILFINKVDRLIKELQLTPERMQERFIRHINHVNELIKKIAGEELGERWKVKVEDGSVCFGSAFHNWGMSLPYMQKKSMNFKYIIDAYGNDDYKKLAKEAPVHEVVLNAVIKHLPNPVTAQGYRVPHIWHGDAESPAGKSLTHCDPNGPAVFVTTKVVIDPQAGEIAAGRLFSGTLRKGVEVSIAGTPEKGRIQQIYIYNGAKKEIVDQVPAGNIIGISGPKTMPGDTVTNSSEIEAFEGIKHIFDPVITKAIEAKNPADLPKLIEVLRQVSKEDPTVQVEINEETGEHLVHGMGELHLEVIENRIKREKGVDVITSPPIVVYRETVVGKSPEPFEGKSPNKHNKLYFLAEPLPEALVREMKEGSIQEGRIKRKDLELRDKLMKHGFDTKEADGVKDIYRGNIFVDMVRGEVHIGEIMEMVLDMFEDVMRAGPLAREPSIGVRITMVDTKLHEDAIHRGPSQMYPAVREGIRGAMGTARPLLFEPMQVLRFEAPEEYMGEISKLISNKRGQILEMQQEGSEVIVQGKLPVAEMFGMSNDLRSATGGRGTSSLIDQSYERLPDELQQKVLRIIRERKGLKLDAE